MGLNSDFKTYCESIILDTADMETTCGEIAKKLNSIYYELKVEKSEHCYIVGSVGRQTATAKTSDLDVIFDLPKSVYTRFDSYSSNGQSALIQEVKGVLQERYPNTSISGDGQVVVIAFNSYTVELVPAFLQSDNTFKFPDTHDGGTWKITKPIAEQIECKRADISSLGNYFNFCRMLRKWKNNCGVVMGGLLVDTLTYSHFVSNEYFCQKTYSDYYELLKSTFKYLKELNKEQNYWYAVGSNQLVYNSDNGSFIDKARKAFDNLSQYDSDEKRHTALQKVFGNDFPNPINSVQESVSLSTKPYRDTEEFIENQYPIDIRFLLKLDCKVTQNGFRDTLLSSILRDSGILRHNKSLEFFVKYNNTPQPYSILWKVRNVGQEATNRDCIRGQIIKHNREKQNEHSNFHGPHFVECYIIRGGVCVARDRIDVPIGTV